MHKIYCFNNGGPPNFLHAVALGDDGVVVAGHICSTEGFMQLDLGLRNGAMDDGAEVHNRKHDSYDEHFGKGNWTLEWVDTDKHAAHEGLQKAIALNRSLPKEGDDA